MIVKLALVFVLIILITLINVFGNKAMNGNPEIQFKKMKLLGKMTLVISLGIVVLAVNVFH